MRKNNNSSYKIFRMEIKVKTIKIMKLLIKMGLMIKIIKIKFLRIIIQLIYKYNHNKIITIK
jgi:hypothetical protein